MSLNSSPVNCCSYTKTSNNFAKQYWKRCYDCWPSSNDQSQGERGACIECIAVCHEGHTVDSKVRFGNFYCDCGLDNQYNQGCQLNGGHSTIKPAHPPTNPIVIQPIDLDEIEPIGLGGRFPYPHPQLPIHQHPQPNPSTRPHFPNDPAFPVQPMFLQNQAPVSRHVNTNPAFVMGSDVQNSK